jgi:hypothetical protein
MLSWGRTQGRAALYSYRGRVEVGAAVNQDDSGKVSWDKPVGNIVMAHHPTQARIGFKSQRKSTRIKLRSESEI